MGLEQLGRCTVPEGKWSEREHVRRAVKRNRSALAQASDDLRDDREIVLKAVKEWGRVLEDASERLRADRV